MFRSYRNGRPTRTAPGPSGRLPPFLTRGLNEIESHNSRSERLVTHRPGGGPASIRRTQEDFVSTKYVREVTLKPLSP